MSRKVTILIFALLAAVSISAFVSSTSAISTNNCSCHSGRSESLGFLIGNAGNALPTTLNVGQTATVRVVLQHTVVGATLNNVINSVSASLASVSSHFSVSAPNVSLGSITGTGTVTATWTITGTSAGADSLRITASGANPHKGISFSDTYSPAPSVNVVASTPPPPPPAAYTLTVTNVGSGSLTKTPNTATYTSGAVVQITATPAAGWSFTGWSGALTGTANPASISMNANKAVTATFTQNPPPSPPVATYTMTVTTVGSGTVSKTPNTAVHTSGSVVQISATPAAGWSFTGWSGGLTSSTNPASVTVSSNLAVTATFTQNPSPPTATSTYTLTITTVGSGSIVKTPNAATYTSGTVVEITAMPSAGWSFAGWIGALTGTANSGSITMDANKAVTATFTQNLPPPPPTTPTTTSEDEDDDDRGYEPEHEDDDDRDHETEHEHDGHRFHETEHDEDGHWSYDSYRSERNHYHDRD